ncbi:MAG: hypothetical protein ACRDZ4_22515 [Egibacteraceae bacterium]
MTAKKDLEEIAKLRAHGLAQGWPVPRIVEAIVDRFDVSLFEAHRLARGWNRRQAVEAILATYDADGLRRPKLTVQRLCAWEHDPRVRPGEDYLDRLCRVYETRADQLGYGHDYTPVAEPAVGATGAEPPAAYAGHETRSEGKEADANRAQFMQGVAASGLAALLDQAGRASERLSRQLGASNLGPATLEQLELRVAGFVQTYDHTPLETLFVEVFDQQEEVTALLDGAQPLDQRRGLYRIAGQLSMLLGLLSFEFGDSLTARTHLLTAAQLARQVGDRALASWVRMNQSTVALWAGDFRAALDYAQDGQRYATGAMSARLAVRGEACAYARMDDRGGVRDASRRAERGMPSQPASDDGWWVFTPGSFQLYTGSSLLWLGDAKQAEFHTRQAISFFETAPPPLRNPANRAQAQINLAICLVRQDQPDEGLRLAIEALSADRVHVEANLQQAGEVLAASKPAHRDLPAARDLAEQLRSIQASRAVPSPGEG